MDSFTAILLVCLAGVSPADCTEANAVEVRSTRVANEIGCMSGWQEIIARGGDADGEVGRSTYLKTLCRRNAADGLAPAR
jgi:hypothetical protein